MQKSKVTIETEIAAVDEEIQRIAGSMNECRHSYLLNEPVPEHITRRTAGLTTQYHNAEERKALLVEKREKMVRASLEFLTNCVKLITNDKLKAISQAVLDDPRFQRCTAAKKQHQAYDGGLVVHTAEVLDIALSICRVKSLDVDHDVIITASIFHDYAKIWDYVYAPPRTDVREKQGMYAYTDHQQMIRHLPRSYAVFMENVGHNDAEVSEELKMKIGHCILAHHGRKEWGSPVEPQTAEAYAIHFGDMMSANCTKGCY